MNKSAATGNINQQQPQPQPSEVKQLPIAPPLPDFLTQPPPAPNTSSSLHANNKFGSSKMSTISKTGTLASNSSAASGNGGGDQSANNNNNNTYLNSKDMIYNQDLHEKLIKEIHNKSLERSKKDSSIFLDEHGNLINRPTNRVYSSSISTSTSSSSHLLSNNFSQFKFQKLGNKFKVNYNRYFLLFFYLTF